MKRNFWLVLAVLAIVAMVFVPRRAYSMELETRLLPGVPSIPALPTPSCPVVPAINPDWRTPQLPTFPSRDIRVPAEPLQLPSRRIPGPVLPIPVVVAPARLPATARPKGVLVMADALATSAASAQNAQASVKLAAAFDGTRASASTRSDEAVIVVPQQKRRRVTRSEGRLTLPESDLESEIGIK